MFALFLDQQDQQTCNLYIEQTNKVEQTPMQTSPCNSHHVKCYLVLQFPANKQQAFVYFILAQVFYKLKINKTAYQD